MSLLNELGLKEPVKLLAHEALLSTYFTASCLRKKAGHFLQPFGLTDVQFNLMMLLQHQTGHDEPLAQSRLSDMMLVNRANITSLIDRMEKAGLVIRTSSPSDRRYNIIVLTPYGKKLLSKIEPLYAKEVKRIMGVLLEDNQKQLIKMLEKIRSNISERAEATR
jgi:MarR family 2-MHQ and catechol resistance regulon transcriptional repressor